MKVPLKTNSQMRLPRPIHLPLTISWTNYWRPDSLAVKGNKTHVQLNSIFFFQVIQHKFRCQRDENLTIIQLVLMFDITQLITKEVSSLNLYNHRKIVRDGMKVKVLAIKLICHSRVLQLQTTLSTIFAAACVSKNDLKVLMNSSCFRSKNTSYSQLHNVDQSHDHHLPYSLPPLISLLEVLVEYFQLFLCIWQEK